MNSSACNYNSEAEVDDGSCEYESCAGCTEENAPNFNPTATIDDGSCESILGCTNDLACNYNSEATEDDGSCDYTSCLVLGCTDSDACNYDPDADISDGSCQFASEGYDCDGNCLEDTDSDGVCDQFEVFGCDDVDATNYSPQATENDGSCIYPVPGCTDFEACNFDGDADVNDGSCEYTSCAGCTSPEACNYDEDAIYSDDSCVYPEFGYDCDGNCLEDSDGDGVCDPFEIIGCMDSSACNYDEDATDPGSCSYALTNYDCDGNNLQPIFTVAPIDETLQGWQVNSADDVVVEAVVSPYASAFEAQYNGNDCYVQSQEVSIEFDGELIVEGNCQHDYTIFRSWTATDCAGYSSTHYQVITVVDTVSPVLFLPNDISISCDLVDGADLGSATGTDDCGEVSITVSEVIVEGNCNDSYEIHRTFTAEDPCLNTTSGVQIVTVFDDQAPDLVAPEDYIVECSEVIQYAPATATDNCGSFVINENETIIPGSSDGNYSIIRTFVAFDDCGNISSATQTITVVDTTAPVLSIPADYTIECSEELVYASASAIDACGSVSISESIEIVEGNAAGNYVVQRTFVAADDSGNESTATQTITVVDTTAPTLQAPDNFTVSCDEFMRLDDPLAYDACGEVTITSFDTVIPGNSEGNYTVIRTFTATDDAGNTSYEAVQTIYVVDDSGPEITVPDDYTIECSDDIVYDDATAVDNCGEVEISEYQLILPGASLGSYEIYREFTAVDDAGNSSIGIQIITVIDTTAPELSIPEDFTVECSDEINYEDAVATDSCGDVYIDVVSQTIAGSSEGNYTIVRAFTATDDAGNFITLAQTITVVDTTAPELTVPSEATFECSETILYPNASAIDNCGEVELIEEQEIIEGTNPGSYTIIRTFTATDDASNSSSNSQTINVVDSTAPELTIPADYTAECSDAIDFESAIAQDNCSSTIVEVSEVTTQGEATGNYVITRTFTATDEAGNVSTGVQIITVEDTTAPVLNIPDNIVVECSDEIVLAEATALDNCSDVTITIDETTTLGSSIGNYQITRTFTATDESGNSSTGVQTITVQDTQSPVINAPADYTIECSDIVVYEDATAEDCGEVSFSITSKLSLDLLRGHILSIANSLQLMMQVMYQLLFK